MKRINYHPEDYKQLLSKIIRDGNKLEKICEENLKMLDKLL